MKSREEYNAATLIPGNRPSVVDDLEYLVFEARHQIVGLSLSPRPNKSVLRHYAKVRDDARVALSALYGRIAP